MSKPDFEKTANSLRKQWFDTEYGDAIAADFMECLQAAFDAGLERAAEMADEEATGLRVARSNANAFNDRSESERLDAAASAVDHAASAIRAEKSQ